MEPNPSQQKNFRILVEALFRTGSIVDAIRAANLTPGRAARILEGRRARKLIDAYRRLEDTHKRCVLGRSLPAIEALLRHLQAEGDPGLQLRSALSLLQYSTPKPGRDDPSQTRSDDDDEYTYQ